MSMPLPTLPTAPGAVWHCETAEPDGRGIRVGFLSRMAMTDVVQVSAFPAGLRPVQVDDSGTPTSVMGRAALRVRVQVGGRAVDLVTCHLKSKLLTFPGGRFSTRDEGERARFGAYALNRRAAEAVTVRAAVTELLTADAGAGVTASVVLLASILGSVLLADCEGACAAGLRGTPVQPSADTARIPLL